MMNPRSMGATLYDPPAGDGSDCGRMAASLRRVLGMEYGAAFCAHTGRMERRVLLSGALM